MQDIQSWLAELGLEKYASAFVEAEIDFEILPSLDKEDLKDLGLPIGPRRKIMDAIQELGDTSVSLPLTTADLELTPTPSPDTSASSSDAERRHLTVMFVDLVGSTEMATRLDAEDMRNVITGYQNTVAGVVGRYEGFVAKFMGDGVMCYFGWPRAGEDDAERAVRAGLAIIDSIRSTRASDGTALATRIGVATGVVIVGDLIGSGATQEAAVVGETPNLAARLQGVAEPNQIVLPKETQRLLGNAYTLRSIGDQALKGISGSVEAFVVEGEASVESRFAARQSGTLTPIVGRDREIELMLERWSLAKSGQGQLLIVSGEAGIGKSRITRAMIDEMERDDHIRMTYQCSPYHADSAFYPVIQQMLFAAGINQADTPDERLDKIEVLLGADNEALQFVAPMMGLDGETRYGKLQLTPAQQRARTMKALTGLLVEQARDKPLLLVYEDLHWIDPTSLELLDLLLDTIADQNIMILATARPSFEYGFGGHPIVTRFALNRLGKDQIGAIVSKLTDGKTLPDEIMEIIASRTDGVPLFVEELTKTILESGALKEDGDRLILDGPLSTIAIPTTLHDSLMARLDRLQPIKEVAQTAACIGREFSHELLAQVSHLPDTELTTALDGLIEAELIYRRGLPPEATYLFKHALVRDAAYESLLKEKRRAVHTRILTAMESDSDAAPEVLAVHAEEANLTDRAVDLWEQAAKVAIARPAFYEGISNLRRAIGLIAPNANEEDSQLVERALALQVQLGMACLQGVGYSSDETKEAMERALVLADMIGDTPLRYNVLYALWAGSYVRAEHSEAGLVAKEMLQSAERREDTAQLTLSYRGWGIYLMMSGKLSDAQVFFDRSLAAYNPVHHDGLAHIYGQELGVAANVYQALNRLFLGKTRSSTQHALEAEKKAWESGHINTICYLHGHLLMGAIVANDMAAVEHHATKLEPIVTEHNLHIWLIWAKLGAHLVKASRGDSSDFAEFIQNITEMVASKNRVFLPFVLVAAGMQALKFDLVEQAIDLADKADGMVATTGEVVSMPQVFRLKAAIAKASGDGEATQQYLKTSLEIAKKQGAKLWELRASVDLARLMQEQERTDEAIAILKPITDSISEGDCPDDQAKAKELLNVLTG